MQQGKRVCVWDNLKCVLIFLVVVGHFVNQFEDESSIMRSISFFIYSFHMPLFIFLSGLLEKRWDENRPFQWTKPVYYILIGYWLKVFIYAIKVFFGRNARFDFFGDTGCPWYMFAMAAFMVLARILQKYSPRIVLPVSIIIACLAGYVPSIGSFLYLSRILVFFPFYYVGFLLTPDMVLRFVRDKRVKAGGVLILGILFLVSFVCIDEVYSYIRLLTGRNAYQMIHVPSCGAVHRFLWYILSGMAGVSVISLIPEKSHPMAGMIGQRTLQIYFWHRLVLYVMMYTGAADVLKSVIPYLWISVYLTIAMGLTLFLSLNVFGKPLKSLKKYEQKVIRYLSGAIPQGM